MPFNSLDMLANGCRLFWGKCVEGLDVDVERSYANLAGSTAMTSVFLESLGYRRVTALVKQAEAEHRPFVDLVIDEGLLTEAQVDAAMMSAALGRSDSQASV